MEKIPKKFRVLFHVVLVDEREDNVAIKLSQSLCDNDIYRDNIINIQTERDEVHDFVRLTVWYKPI